jgi:predicted RNA methylase
MILTGLKRNDLDKFYTKKEVARECINDFFRIVHPSINDMIVEPSAGNGSFSKQLEFFTENLISYDIHPENDNIIKMDFLETDLKNCKQSIHIIGNPPFGKQSKLAKLFIKKSCQFSKSISFILPKSFKKDSFKNTFDKFFHLIYEKDLEKNAFLINNKEYDVPCVFQIWVRYDYERKIPEKLRSKYFKFVKITENPDFSFRRVGVYAGKLDREIDNKSTESHYFLKLIGIDIKEFIEKYKNVNFLHDNTVGPRSISKQELIQKTNEI